MQELKQLQKQWNDVGRFRGVQANLSLGSDAVTLGAGTVVAKRQDDGSIILDGEEERMLVLLSVAYGQPLDPSVLASFRCASKSASAGDECMAAMHIALAKLPRITDPGDAARRLFIADGLTAAGVAPRDIWKALGFDPAVLNALEKYDQDEPRVPAGSGKPSGQWTSGGTSLGGAAVAIGAAASSVAAIGRETAQRAEAQLPKALARLPSIAARLAEVVSHLNLVLDVAQEVLQPSDAGGTVISGKVSGLPNAYYQRHQDELALQLIDKSTGHSIATLYPTGVRGQYIDRESGIVAQMEGDELVLRSATGTMSQTQTRTKPQLCPEPKVPDYEGMVGPRADRSKAYEAVMRERTNPNPEETTPPGMAYGLINPETGELIKFDDCEHSTGDMMEYKGLGLAELLQYEPSRTNIGNDMVRQATNQVLASEGRHLVWNFAELPTLEYARTLFQGNPLLAGIELRYEPWPEGETWRWSRAKNQWLRSIHYLNPNLRKYFMPLRRYDKHLSFS